MRSGVAVLPALILVASASCGGSPPTVAPVTPAAPSATVPTAAAPAPPPDVSPLPEPGGLSFTVHFSHPRATFQQFALLLGPAAALLTGGGNPDLESLVGMAIGAPVGAVVDLDRPLDFAVSDVDTPGVAMKLAGAGVLLDPAAARETLGKYYEASDTSPGVVRLEPRKDAPDDASPRPCVLTPSVSSTTRIVCGDSPEAVRHLAPYMARTMARLPGEDDLRVEIFVRELHIPKSGTMHELGPGGSTVVDGGAPDPADKLVDDLTEKLTADINSLVIEASTDGTTADVRLTTSFGAVQSPLTRALVGLGAPATPPPAAFDRLPRDASFAWFGRGATAADLAPLRSTVFDYLQTYLLDDGFTQPMVETLLAPYEQLFLTGGSWLVASGIPLDTARTGLDAYVDGGKTTEAARSKARAAMQGWFVASVEEPAQRWTDAIRDIVKHDDAKPTGKARRKREPEKQSTKLAIRPVPAPLQLPAGTLHVEAHVTQNPAWLAAQAKGKRKLTAPQDPVLPHTVHVFIVPDGGRTWFAAAEDASLAATEVRASLAGAPATGTLASRRDLDALRAMPATSAGFLSVAALATWLAGGSADQGLRRARETLSGLASLTNGGQTPIPLALTASPKGSGGDVRLRILFPISIATEIAASPHSIF